MAIEKRVIPSLLNIWFPVFWMIIIALTGYISYLELWEIAGPIFLFGILVTLISFTSVKPAFAGLVLRFGGRVIVSVRTIYYQLVNEIKKDLTVGEAQMARLDLNAPKVFEETIVNYLAKREGWRFPFPIIERIAQLSLKLIEEEINERKENEKEEVYKERAESFTTYEGAHIIPEVFYAYRVTNPGTVFGLEGGIDKSGESPFLKKTLHDLILGGARGVLAKMELTKILSRVVEHNGRDIPIGQKIKIDIESTQNWDQLGCEILFVRIEEIAFKKDAQDLLNALEAVKKQEFERERQKIDVETQLQVRTIQAQASLVERQREADGIKALADSTLYRLQKEAAGLKAQVLAFNGKEPDEKIIESDSERFGNYSVGLERAKSLATNTKIVVIPADRASTVIAGLTSIFEALKPT